MKSDEPVMRDEYDLRGGVRGKYYERYWDAVNNLTWTSSTSNIVISREQTRVNIPGGSVKSWRRGVWING